MTSEKLCGFDHPIRVLVVGARDGIGKAFRDELEQHPLAKVVFASSRHPDFELRRDENLTLDITDASRCEAVSQQIKERVGGLDCIINCSGLLHGSDFGPERTWRHFDMETMTKVFSVNTFGVGLLLRYFMPLLPRRGRGVFASLSARVGSISDNRLGGWYSYRASKAAQHMFIRCASIEAKRSLPDALCVALHPGTVDTELSAPFTQRTPPERLFSPTQSARYLLDVLDGLTVEDTGRVFAWDSTPIEY